MRRLLGLIAPGEAAERSPQPDIDRVPALVDERARRPGLTSTLESEGDPRAVPAGVGASAYRIVQEALTNAAKHAERGRASVALRWQPERARDRGRRTTASSAHANGSGGGRGLIGMRERVELVGGRFEAGPRGADGYRVWARLPLERRAVSVDVVLADDQELVRAGLEMILDATDDLRVVGPGGRRRRGRRARRGGCAPTSC